MKPTHVLIRPPVLAALLLPLALAGLGLISGGGSQGGEARSTATAKDALPFRVPPGFVAERVAGPPVVDYPLVADFDERGQLFVAHAAGRNVDFNQTPDERPNAMRLLEDTDGDGRFERYTVFADKMTFPTGALWYDGALYACSPPYLWRMQDTKGKGVADVRKELVGKFGFRGHAGDIHGPFLGPDGRLYWTDGLLGHRIERRGAPPIGGSASRIYRCKPDGSDVEVVCGGGMDNSVMMTFTAEGEPLSTSTLLNSYPARYDGIIYCIDGGVYPHHAHLIAEFKRTGDLLPPVANLGHVSPSGIHRYRSTAFGADYRDNLFVALYNTHKVQRLHLERDGASFRVRAEDFLVSDSPYFHPTYVVEDADGSLLVVDTGGWFQIGCYINTLNPKAKGGIYRVRRRGAPRMEDPRGLALRWDRLTPAELTRLLDDPRFVVRDRAVLGLAKQGAGAVGALEEVVRCGRSARARRNAVWALTRMECPASLAVLREALDDRNVSVRLSALHAVGLHRDGKARQRLMELVVKDPVPAVRRQAATALGRIRHKEAVPALLQGLKTGPDVFLQHALIYAIIETADRAGTLKGLHDPDDAVRRGALIALDQMEGGNLSPEQVSPLLDPAHAELREEALKVLIAHPHWAGELSAVFRRWLLDDQLAGQRPEELRRLLLAFCRDTDTQDLIARALRRERLPVSTRLLLLETIAQAPLDRLPAVWVAELRWCLDHADPRIVRQAVADIRIGGGAELDAALLQLAADRSQPADFRVEALAAAGPRIATLEEGHFKLLTGCLDREQPPLLRLAAAGTIGQCGAALGKSGLNDEQLAALVPLVARAGPLEIPRLLEVYERINNPPLAKKLIAALAAAPALESLTPAAVRAALQGYPEDVQQAARPLLKRLEPDAAQRKARLDELAEVLKCGDGHRGKLVFFGKKAACSTCHTAQSQGGSVGPDLSKIGSIRTGPDLLEAVAFPSQSFARGYEPYVVTTRSGKTHPAGLLRRQTADAVYLVTAERAEVRIPRSDIESLEPSKVSIMPQGLDAQLSRRELADLIAFLESLR
jgi:putative membrane-bound dehydrogenase-like protein